jgi:hypothetical protein
VFRLYAFGDILGYLSAILLHLCIHVYMVYISILFHRIIYYLICNQLLFTMSNLNIFHLVVKHVHVIVLTIKHQPCQALT